MAGTNPITQAIVRGARARGDDPNAVLAVASQEGLSGGIGDGGHAYGPFQLNNSGGVITKQYGGRVNDPAVQAWANSPAGINYALGQIDQVAHGLHGQQAVNAIVTRFERPANPGREIAGANAAYGHMGAAGGPVAVAPGFAAPKPINTLQTAGGGNIGAALKLLGFSPPSQPAAPQAPTVAPPRPAGAAGGAIAKNALSQQGTPYQWGGQAKLGSRTDCSGLLQAAASAAGINIGRTTYEQWKQGTPVAMNQLQPGDAVFFHPGPQGPQHVAIYIGNGKVVEDPHTGATVEVSQLGGRGAIGARRYA